VRGGAAERTGPVWRGRGGALRPMLAVLAEETAHDRVLSRDDLVFEPKYDGIRALIEVEPAGDPSATAQAPRIRIWSRLGNDKTAQFPEVVEALDALAHTVGGPLLLDGEIVAVDAAGGALPFQHLQGRMHLRGRPRSTLPPTAAVFIAFDLLRDGDEDLRPLPFIDRRARLLRYASQLQGPVVRIIRSQIGGGLPLRAEGLSDDWEGVVAKDPKSRYLSGKRHPGWQKIKFVKRQEFVVGGWTEGRLSRTHFGALVIGYYAPPDRHTPSAPTSGETTADKLVYAGHVGSGFNDAQLEAISDHLRGIETDTSPFVDFPRTNERAHWVHPALVIDVKFTQWTADDVLRNPVYLGVRTDKTPGEVRREDGRRKQEKGTAGSARTRRPSRRAAGHAPVTVSRPTPATDLKTAPTTDPKPYPKMDPKMDPKIDALCDQLRELEASRKRGTLVLPDGGQVPIGNLHKVFWPEPGLSKGDLVRFNLRISPYLLPVVADRPLVMKRFPNGIDGKWFYQHRSPDQIPDGVRVAMVRESLSRAETGVPYLIGGTLQTLAYMAQLAVISQDPWFSRLPDIEQADVVALDLDPMPDTPFSRVIEVARWLHDELERLGTPCVAKTSGSSGVHIYIPLPPGTPYEAGMIFCQILATIVASRHPKAATVERMVKKRPTDVVYIDYLQNIYGKTLATAYSARASTFAGVSTPLTWDEVHDGLKTGLAPQDFTMETIFTRLDGVGDLWAELRTGAPADLHAILQYAESLGG
jgi:bifunctional non-homologous end joining protein LigD